MTFPEFKEIVDKMVESYKTIDSIYKLKIDLYESLSDYDFVIEKLWGHILTEFGEDWFNWYMYEKGGITGAPKELITANDSDGTEICKDLEGLYDYLIKNKYFKYYVK